MHLTRNALYCLLALLLPWMAIAAPAQELTADEVIRRVKARHAGEIIKISREQINERWVFRVRMLANGHMTERRIDAVTGSDVNQQERAE